MKRFHLRAIVIAIASILLFWGCSKSSVQSLSSGTNPPPGSTCDTAGMSYSNNVVPILQSNCYSCHGTGSSSGSGGIILDNYVSLKKWADNGKLAGNIRHDPGYVGMPYGQAKMDACTINKIVDWVNSGSPNN